MVTCTCASNGKKGLIDDVETQIARNDPLTGNIDNSKKLTNDILRELIRFYQIGKFTMPKTEIVIIHSVAET